jgi:glycosyltransferase involved in cell wall biosynthesis
LATFNANLAVHLTTRGSRAGIVRVTAAGDDPRAEPGVVHTWSARTAGGWRAGADALSGYDVAVVQHEYGIYPGEDGEDVVPFLRRLAVPSIVVLHTVLSHPTTTQKLLLEQVVSAADAVVTMTGTARDRLLIGYAVDAAKVSVIPHGATDHHVNLASRSPRSHLLTWGLIGPGKGIEWALRAVARLRDVRPALRYTVAGRTHPKVIERDGEAYRTRLEDLSVLLGIEHAVDFQSAYQDDASLQRLIGSADVVVLPYDSREQVTSGVLIEAVAAGIPVVATSFPHAVELLTDGPGLVVPHRDSRALADAVRRVLTEPGLAAGLAGRSRPLAAAVRWPTVAQRYEALAERLIRDHTGALGVASA